MTGKIFGRHLDVVFDDLAFGYVGVGVEAFVEVFEFNFS